MNAPMKRRLKDLGKVTILEEYGASLNAPMKRRLKVCCTRPPRNRRKEFAESKEMCDEPRVATATTLDDSTLLRISKEDFFDLLSDHTNITESVFKALVKKIRSLIRD